MNRCKIPIGLSKNIMAALSENGQLINSSSTPNAFDKTKEVLANAGSKDKQKANEKIDNAKELAKDNYVNREMSAGHQYGPGSFGEKIQGKEKELSAMDCPPVMMRDLISLFPDQKLTGHSKMTVLNLTQKSDNDMSAWSQQMEMERDQLTAGFIESAMSICEQLERDGFWADFIDPSTGRPFLSRFTNSTLFETDEKYNQLGFKVEDLGCCKVVKHVLWGSYVFVGTIFTNASLEDKAIQNVLSKVKEESSRSVTNTWSTAPTTHQ